MWIITGRHNGKKARMAKERRRNKAKKMRRKKDEKIHNIAPLFFPDEIMFEILSRLPVESLLRFKFVCKQWYDIIKDDKFVEMHTRGDKGVTYCYSKREGETLNLDGVEETFTCLHAVDGLLLWRSISSDKYYIRNPSTKQILNLPYPHKKVWLMRIFYHSSIGAYNVVSIYLGEKGKSEYNCEVLDLGNDDPSWRPLNISKFHDLRPEKVMIRFTVLDLILYCLRLAEVGSRNSEIICFDLEKEVSTSVTVPRSFFSEWRDVKFIGWDGKPALAYFVEGELLNVWVLEDYKKQKWSDCKIVISMPFLKNPNLKGLCPVVARDGVVILVHVNMVESFKYVIASKELQQFPAASWDIVRVKATLVTLKGMQPETKTRCLNELKKV